MSLREGYIRQHRCRYESDDLIDLLERADGYLCRLFHVRVRHLLRLPPSEEKVRDGGAGRASPFRHL